MDDFPPILPVIDEAIAKKRQVKEQNSWYSSGLGSCPTSRYLERMGAVPDHDFDSRTLRVFEMGNLIETFVVDNLKEKYPDAELQSRFEFNGMSGKADIVLGDDIKEVKSVRSDDYWMMARGKRPPKIQHRMQLWSQLEGLKKPRGSIVYVSKDDLSITEFIVYRDSEGLREAVTAELGLMNRAWEAKLPPPPVRWDFDARRFTELTKDDWQIKYSRFRDQVFTQSEYLKI